ncbi:hypothetical protein F0562_003510 [Nyssa sinensis]|uniref:Integrase catalytic domain-containing protein n=1 Tax=Nyssa sinensis TaxID=561372 RepID=A0A5J5C0Y5_9ASTE|nr:hypothetical protein F0562_003510 [Nyssa sinensis]
MVVVDRFSKYAHFVPISHPCTAAGVAQTYFEHIFKLHGMPRNIVCDRDPIFTSGFWSELFCLNDTEFNYSSAYHPQTDGQSKVVNRTMEMYLRFFTSSQPKDWNKWLTWTEYYYNTSWHSAIKKTPFEVVYRRTPPTLLSYIHRTAKATSVEEELLSRDQMVKELRVNLKEAQETMKKFKHVKKSESLAAYGTPFKKDRVLSLDVARKKLEGLVLRFLTIFPF